MKKRLMMGLALMLMLCLAASSALAVDTTLKVSEKGEYGYYASIWGMVPAGDSVYFLIENPDVYYLAQLAYWRPGMDDAERFEGEFVNAQYFSTMDDMKENIKENGLSTDVEHAISMIFGDGERLMAFNRFTDTVFEIVVDAGEISFKDIVQIKDTSAAYHTSGEESYYIGVGRVLCAGNQMLWLMSDWSEDTGRTFWKMACFDLTDGSVKNATVEGVREMTAYKDGKVLLLQQNGDGYDQEKKEYLPWNVLVYDPATDKADKVTELTYGKHYWSPDYFLYSKALDALIYDHDTRVMGLFNNFTEEQQVGYMPLQYMWNGIVAGDSILVNAGVDDGVVVRTLTKDFKADEYVNVYGMMPHDLEYRFAEKYPQIPVYKLENNTSESDAMAIDVLMKSGANAPDVLQMSVEYSVFTRLMAKKGCADLSGYPELAAYVADLYPVYRDAITGENGEIYAIPRTVSSYDGIFVNKRMMEEMGLTAEDIPTNFVELCAFVTRWNDEFVEKFPNYAPMEYHDYKASMFYDMFQRYIDYCQAEGMALKFDTPVFRDLMAALDAMKVKELQESLKSPDPEISDYKQGLISIGNHLLGNWTDYMADWSNRMFLPMTLTKDTGYYIPAEMDVYFINPLSERKDAAAKLLACLIEGLPDSYVYTLLSSKTEPIENKYYEQNVKNEEEYLAKLEEGFDQVAEADRVDFQAMLDAERRWLEELKRTGRYDISPTAIAWYQETILPLVFVQTPSLLTGESGNTEVFDSLIQQYQDGKIDLERFIREADGKLLMMQME